MIADMFFSFAVLGKKSLKFKGFSRNLKDCGKLFESCILMAFHSVPKYVVQLEIRSSVQYTSQTQNFSLAQYSDNFTYYYRLVFNLIYLINFEL